MNPAFIENLKKYAVDIRANPEHQNGSLIIAAGLRSPALIKEIIEIGKQAQQKKKRMAQM